ncbi:hypothetical protein NLM24_22680 [Nocardia zapadnayensis]|uniref:hypothetical protein n=1 Tax=Nocardia rhamnosiphila TaxID=426716 RepID=UPI0022461850|nr:hypothetical protein [Nocardia zapadnayensis]MCX0273446.1 hypothetical protein [Nocardia zapadnayensis]
MSSKKPATDADWMIARPPMVDETLTKVIIVPTQATASTHQRLRGPESAMAGVGAAWESSRIADSD